jgi:endo-1,4-beta-xylanase
MPDDRRRVFDDLRRTSRREWLGGAAACLLSGAGRRSLRGQGWMGRRREAPADSAQMHFLRAAGSARGLLVGCAVDVARVRSDPAYAGLVMEQAGILVAENEMKWQAVHPERDRYDFEAADYLVWFCERQSMKLRGHNLCWHRSIPAWVTAMTPGKGTRGLLPEHIECVAGRYAGRMHSWDVVNEAIEVKDGRPDGLRLSPWLAIGGDDYIEVAFRAARAADPQALLTYNDYGLEGQSAEAEKKRMATMMLIRRMKARNVPIDAIGIQSHLSAPGGGQAGDGLMRFLREMRELDLQIFLTEMDVNDRALAAAEGPRDEAVAAVYGGYLDRVLAEPRVKVLLTWGITDRYTWLNHEGARADHLPERALPFDRDYKPKAAFEAMRDAINRRDATAKRVG